MRLKLKEMQYLAKQIAFNVEKTGKQYSFWGDYSCNVAVCNNLTEVLDEIAHEFTNLVNKKLVLVVQTPETIAAFFARKSVVAKTQSGFFFGLYDYNIYLPLYSCQVISKGKNYSVLLYSQREKSA